MMTSKVDQHPGPFNFTKDISTSVFADFDPVSTWIVSCYRGNSNGLSRVTVKPRFRISAPGSTTAAQRSWNSQQTIPLRLVVGTACWTQKEREREREPQSTKRLFVASRDLV